MICTIIPTFNAGESLEALHQQLQPHVRRIVISDGGSTDETLTITAQRQDIIAAGRSGRGSQLKRGARWAGDCEWLLFLHADSKLPEDWHVLVSAFIADGPDHAGYFDLKFDSWKWAAGMVEGWVKARCFYFALPYGDQGLLISRKLYDEIGGYDDIPLFEDVAIVRALGRKRLKRIGTTLTTSADKYERDGYFRRGWRNLKLLRRYLKGESPHELAKVYT